jgi:hypothetical protein
VHRQYHNNSSKLGAFKEAHQTQCRSESPRHPFRFYFGSAYDAGSCPLLL